MNHTNRTHLPRQISFICQSDVLVTGNDMMGKPVLQRPYLMATIDIYSRTILGCRAILVSDINLKKIHRVTTP